MAVQLHSSSLAEWLLWHHPRFRRGRYAGRKGTGKLSASEVRAVDRRFAVLEPEVEYYEAPRQSGDTDSAAAGTH